MKLAAVTMVYNEPDYMGLWCRHYGAQVGPAHCYVIDHGTEDGTTDDLGEINVVRIARSPMDDAFRAELVSDFCADLLTRYDAVVHGDVDELLIADPRYHRHLADCAREMTGPVTHAVGLEVWHLAAAEPAIDIAQPVSLQRSWTWFKLGFMQARSGARTGPLGTPASIASMRLWPSSTCFLFHLRYFDRERGLQRLARTRAMAWAHDHAGGHQRQPDESWLKLLHDVAALPKAAPGDVDVGREPLAPLLAKVTDSQTGRETDTYRIDLGIHGGSLIPIPLRFQGRF